MEQEGRSSAAAAADPALDPKLEAPMETVFTSFKAGMQGVDKERIKAIVHEMSKGSEHHKNEQRKMAITESRIQRMKAEASRLTRDQLNTMERTADSRVAELLACQELGRTWLHVDMDAFFASVAERDDPQLRGVPFAVGGMGMISTANYIARQYGVRSAMPGFIAVKLCPNLKFVKPDFTKYQAAAAETRRVFEAYDPEFEALSLDEAALDVTDHCAQHGVKGPQVAADIRKRVEEATKLTCSVGIAPNRMLAKICSDKNKPNGQYELEASSQAVQAFARELDIRRVPGIGKVTEHILRAFGVGTCADILEKRALIVALFSTTSCEHFFHAALGLGQTRHAPPAVEGSVGRKGIGCERTFRNMSTPEALEAKCAELAKQLASEMTSEGLKGKTLTLKLKESNFELRTRAVTLDRYISSAEDILAAGLKLLRAEMPIEIRLMGLRVSGFHETILPPGQTSLDGLLLKAPDSRAGSETGAVIGDKPAAAAAAAERAATGDTPAAERAATGDTPAAGALPGESTAAAEGDAGDDAGAGLAGPGALGEWACPACTLLNQGLAGWCEACGSRRPPRKPKQQARGDGSGAKQKRGREWTLDRYLQRAGPTAAAPPPLQGDGGESSDIVECDVCGEWLAEGDLEQHKAAAHAR